MDSAVQSCRLGEELGPTVTPRHDRVSTARERPVLDPGWSGVSQAVRAWPFIIPANDPDESGEGLRLFVRGLAFGIPMSAVLWAAIYGLFRVTLS